ncbi:MAG: phosphoribosylanthranilate isomerase [Lachnospiraceae bacterium]|nr:phosphoribosylanthranilate isomerase [Lachnospiraceae bacterium]
MTKIKLCGMMQMKDIEAANRLRPDLIGFVFARKSRRYVTDVAASELRAALSDQIPAAGVFVNEEIDHVVHLLNQGVIDLVQLHGDEDEAYMKELRHLTDAPFIKAFRIREREDIAKVRAFDDNTTILLDAGSGDGMTFRWEWLKDADYDYFLAGGLTSENVAAAVRNHHPYGVDVSSGIETNGQKDVRKMEDFVITVRKENDNA